MLRKTTMLLLLWSAAALADPPSPRASSKESATTSSAGPSAKPERLYSRAQTTWVYRLPKKEKHPLGYVRLGQSVKLRGEAAVKGPGCADLFYPVEPYGWVCLDRAATLDGEGRWMRAMRSTEPADKLMPFGYALSNGAPMYRRLPSEAEVAKEARQFGKAGSFRPQSWGNRGHEKLAEARVVKAVDPVPWFLNGGGSAGEEKPMALLRREIPHGSMLAYTKAFEHQGRSYLLSADGTVVPADRVRPFRQSEFKGVELGDKVTLPIAFMRQKARPKQRRNEDGTFQATGASWPVRSWVALDPSADAVEANGKRYLATRERDARGATLFVLEDDATVLKQRDGLPIGVSAGSKWLYISITNGTLIAYSGEKPVFATLQSPGAGGVPVPGKNPVKMSTTPLGVYRITFKHRASTMSPEYGDKRKFWIADVPYTQYFNAPFALHTAYWHESFGEPMSAGCVNVSPLDGKWLYDWTDPKVPDGWGGAGPGGPHGVGTYVVIAR